VKSGNGASASAASWREVGPLPGRRGAPLVVKVIPLLAIAVVLHLLQRTDLAVLVLFLGGGLLVASTVSPRFAATADRVQHAISRLVGHALGFVLLGVVELLVLVPIAAVSRLLRRDPMARPAGWARTPVAAADAPRRLYAAEAVAVVPAWRRRARLVPVAVGSVVVILLADLAVGAALDDQLGLPDAPEQQTASMREQMVDVPWSDAYWDEVDALTTSYVPFLMSRTDDVDGQNITVQDGVRTSWTAPDLPADAPVVWFFGGSTMWGLGHRDDHTIPSEVARLAADAGTPIRVVNLGERGYTSWQGIQRFERALAAGPAPAAAVFYDGANDLGAQLQDPRPGATHFNPGVTEQLLEEEEETSWWDAYRNRSVLARALDRVRQELDPPAGAQTPPTAPQPAQPGSDAADAVRWTVDSYQRTRLLATHLAQEAGVHPLFVWQPVEAGGTGSVYDDAAGQVGDPTVDLSALLAGEDDLWLDATHTTEAGARVVAQALWAELAPQLGAAS